MRCLTAILALCLTLQVVTSAAVVQEEEDSALVSGTSGFCKCGPDAYETKIAGVTGTPAKEARGSYHIEVKKQRMAVYHNVSMGGGKVAPTILIIRDKYAYIIFPNLKICKKSPYRDKISTCINQKAKHTQSFYLGGAGGAKLAVDGWEMPSAQVNTFATIFFSADKCIMTVAVSGDVKQTSPMAFYNATLGIVDPKVFNVPSYCNKAVDEEAAHHLAQQLLEAHQARQRFFE